jgi:hypothetical protein
MFVPHFGQSISQTLWIILDDLGMKEKQGKWLEYTIILLVPGWVELKPFLEIFKLMQRFYWINQ